MNNAPLLIGITLCLLSQTVHHRTATRLIENKDQSVALRSQVNDAVAPNCSQHGINKGRAIGKCRSWIFLDSQFCIRNWVFITVNLG